MKKYSLLFLLLFISCVPQKTNDPPQETDLWTSHNQVPLGELVTIQGQLKTGAEAGMKHCPEALYLMDSTGVIQIRTLQNKKLTILTDLSYAGKYVKIQGRYDPNAVQCEALLCSCDDYLIAETIEILSAPTPTNFEQCAQQYSVQESYPRRCVTPDGKQFVEEIPSPQTSCQKDEDCQLMNQALGYGCCWAGACEAIDYSLDKWVAVNANWFNEQRRQNCPSSEECGPAPLCDARAINENYAARCVQGKCQKAPEPGPQEKACKDHCGDGICQEMVCLALGCPCSENSESCPQDCTEGGSGAAICGNNLCEEDEADWCPPCSKSVPPCLAPCRTGKYVDCSAPVCNPIVR